MKKYILAGILIVVSLPLLSHAAESTDGPLTQTQVDYILKQNCDSFAGDTKNFCLQMKGRAQIQVRLAKVAPTADGNIATPPSQPLPTTIAPNNTPPNTQEPKKDVPHTAQPPRDTPSVNPQPPKNDGDMNRAPLQDGPTRPQAQKGNLDISRSTEPSHDGTGTHENHDQKPILPPSRDGSGIDQPPKDNNDMNKPPRDGVGQAVEKLSPADREELMKLIRSFLESKGVQVTLPAHPAPGTMRSTEPVKPTPNTDTGTEPTNPILTNTERQNRNQTRRTSPKRKTPPSISSSTSISVSTK